VASAHLTRRSLIAVLIGTTLVGACRHNPEQTRDARMKTAGQYLAEHKYREAIVELRGAVQATPSFGPAHLQLGDAYMAVGDGTNAIREYVTAADLMGDSAEAQLKAGRLLLLAGQFDSARDRAKKVLAKNANDVDGLILLGNAMAALKDLDGAITEVESAIAQDPDRGLSYSNLGMIQMARGDREKAEEAFARAVQLDPKSLPATLALANFYWAGGRLDDAERTLKQAADLAPSNATVQRALAAFYLGSNRMSEAEPHLKAAAESTTALGPQLVLADYYTRAGKTSEAMSWLSSVAKRQDGFVPASIRIAALQYQAGNHVDAERTIDAALAKSPRDPEAQIVKAMILTNQHRLDEALTHATAAVASAPQFPRAQMMAGSVYALLGKQDEAIRAFQEALKYSPGNPDAQVALARLYGARGDWSMARQFAQGALKSAPSSEDARVLLARAQTESGALDDAKRELDTLNAKSSTDAGVQYALGRYYAKSGDKPRARQAFSSALRGGDDDAAPLAGLVDLDIKEGKPQEARARVEEQLQNAPKSPRLSLLAAHAYAVSGDMVNAERALRNAISVDPSYLDAYEALARLLLSQHRADEALQEFEAIVARNPKSIAAHTMAGILLEQQGKTAQARKHYEQAIAADPRAAVSANNLAWLMSEAGENLDIALQLAQSAKAQLPDRPEVNDTLGWIYYRKGLSTLSIASLSQSVAGDPKDATYQYHLGLALAQHGDKDRAREVLQRALSLQPNFAGADDARTVLKSLVG
jgi:putative PEP-CTERM system TPR-repeat lipoprotein